MMAFCTSLRDFKCVNVVFSAFNNSSILAETETSKAIFCIVCKIMRSSDEARSIGADSIFAKA